MHISQSTLIRNPHKRQDSYCSIPNERSPTPNNKSHQTINNNSNNHLKYSLLESMRANSSQKKLTLGLQSYQQIKNAYITCKGIDENCNKKQIYHFTPKTNNKKISNRTFDGFINSQQKYQRKKSEKRQLMKTQMDEQRNIEFTGRPSIDKRSRKISEHLNQDQVFSRLSKQKPNKTNMIIQQEMFKPKILKKSKSLKRTDKVQNLLYNDALRRQQHQKLQKLAQNLPSSPLPPTNKNTNKLVIKKINNQLYDMIQQQSNISPILAISAISEIFNVNLNPNKDIESQQLCHQVLLYLLDGSSSSIENQGYVRKQKLQAFIFAVLGQEKQSNVYTLEQQKQIFLNLGYFYRQRLAKQRKVKQQQPQNFNPKTLNSSNKLAQTYRQKKLDQIAEFINANHDLVNSERTLRIQDMFILDKMRKDAEIKARKNQKDQQILKQCSFRPSLQRKYYVQTKPRQISTKSKKLKTQYIHEYQSQLQIAQNFTSEFTTKQVLQKKTLNTDNSHLTDDKRKKKITLKSKRQAEDYQKNIIRISYGRKVRQFQNNYKERGYKPKQNWIKSRQKQKKQLQEQDQMMKGMHRSYHTLRKSINASYSNHKKAIRY